MGSADDSKTVVGRCPACGQAITEADVLIRYERSGATDGVFADCPACQEIVTPE